MPTPKQTQEPDTLLSPSRGQKPGTKPSLPSTGQPRQGATEIRSEGAPLGTAQNAVADKTPRRTRERILDLSLRLFNEFGEPNVTTTMIAEAMRISPGNLYYHFRNKDDIVDSIFIGLEADISRRLTVPAERRPTIDDVWAYLHSMFKLVWRYRFFYRDQNDLLSRNRTLEVQFKRILSHQISVAEQLCLGLQSDGAMVASPAELAALPTNMVIVATYWLSYEYVRNPRNYAQQDAVTDALLRGCYQVLALTAPYLRGAAREGFDRLVPGMP